MSPRPAALTVDQPGGCRRIADTARQGVEPTSLEVNVATGERTEGNCRTEVPVLRDCNFCPNFPNSIAPAALTLMKLT